MAETRMMSLYGMYCAGMLRVGKSHKLTLMLPWRRPVRIPMRYTLSPKKMREFLIEEGLMNAREAEEFCPDTFRGILAAFSVGGPEPDVRDDRRRDRRNRKDRRDRRNRFEAEVAYRP